MFLWIWLILGIPSLFAVTLAPLIDMEWAEPKEIPFGESRHAILSLTPRVPCKEFSYRLRADEGVKLLSGDLQGSAPCGSKKLQFQIEVPKMQRQAYVILDLDVSLEEAKGQASAHLIPVPLIQSESSQKNGLPKSQIVHILK